jgi:hypothetical protein
MRRPILLSIWFVLAMLLPRSGSAAQIFETVTPAILEMDPSIRSTAMGSASGAVFWGLDPNSWANPALLGTMEGIRYDDALVDLGTITTTGTLGELSFDIRQTARRTAIGHGGIGIGLAGQPFEGAGGARLEFGDLSEEVRLWSAGISLAGIAQTFLGEGTPALDRHFDLAFGYTHKTLEGFGTETTLWDWGLLARAGTDFAVGAIPARVDAAYGYSYLDRTSDVQLDQYARHELNCAGLHVSAGRLPEGFARLPAWLRAGFQPLVSMGGGLDAYYRPGPGSHLDSWGAELGLANMVYLRLGSDRADRATHGYGIGLPVGRFGGFRYDDATVDGLDFDYRAWSVWLDPLAIARAGR